jgi:catalase
MTDSIKLTTENGAPVHDNERSQTAGAFGPVLMQDHHLIEKLARFDRERIPERVVHARGSGAFGTFEVTADVTQWTKAHFLGQVGRKTRMLARFSTVALEAGSADTVRDPRGFALKFYTEEGNYDLVGNNTPIFFIRDAIKFPDFIHSQKRDPFSHVQEPNNAWDFFSHSPEATHQFTWLFGDRGIPRSYRHMDGFGSHTFQWMNSRMEAFWIKYHFKTNQGIQWLTTEQAQQVGGENPNHHHLDLLHAIERGEYPSWRVCIQIMPIGDAYKLRFNPFDVTKVWSQKQYPLIEIGKLTLDRNPGNYFAEIEQAAFNPGNFVPGIGPSPDKMLQGRLFSYGDTQRYRLGVNHTQLPVNCPLATTAANYGRDGAMRYVNGGRGAPNYSPNSVNDAPKEVGHIMYKPIEVIGPASAQRQPQWANDPDAENDYAQAGDLYRLMHEDEKQRLVTNIANSLGAVTRQDIIDRAAVHFYIADHDFGERLYAALRAVQAAAHGDDVSIQVGKPAHSSSKS